MFSRKLTRFVAAGVAAVAVAVGGFAIGNSSSGNGASGTANGAPSTARSQAPRSGQAARSWRAGTQAPVTGKIPKNWRPGTGTIITGATANKAKAAAIAAKYAGTVNRVLKLGDGSYVVHLIATSGPHHVFVSKHFKVTGAA
jgi:hypothetical protein